VRSLLLISVVSWVASAQGFELERLSLNAGARETWLAQTGDGLEPMRLRVSLLGHYQHRPLVYTVDGVEVGAPVASRWTAHLIGAFGLHEYLELGLQVPVVVAQTGSNFGQTSSTGIAPDPVTMTPSTAMGAPWLSVRSTLLRQGEKAPLDLAISLHLSLPLGSAAAYTRDPGLGLAFAPKLGLGRAFGPVRLGAEAGVLLRGTEVLSPTSPTVSDEIGSQFSGALVVSTHGLPIHAELAGRVTAPFTQTGVSVEVLAAVRYTIANQFELSLLGGPGIGKAPGTPAFRVLFGFSWTPDFSTRAP
jgi:OmpA-OmpF porin, OOP family